MKAKFFLIVLLAASVLYSQDNAKGSTETDTPIAGKKPSVLDMNLINAARDGNLAEAKRLVITGASPQGATEKGVDSLMAAAMNGHYLMEKYLLEEGASVTAIDNSGKTALMFAAEKNFDPRPAELLIEKGADVNAYDKKGWTALMFAAYNGNGKVVDMLLAKGANFETENQDGKTALELAKEKGFAKIVKTLHDKELISKPLSF